MKTGYKATYDFTCLDHKFEIGQTYELEGTPIPCEYGFHYCVNSKDVLKYYMIQRNFRLLEVEDLGESIVKEDKTVTNKLRVVREVPKEEYYPLFGIINNELTITNESGNCEKRKFDERNNCIYLEYSSGFWSIHEYDENNNLIYYKESNGYCAKRTYDENNNEIYYEDSSGDWKRRKFDQNNNCIYVECSNGYWQKNTYDESNNCLKTERGHK